MIPLKDDNPTTHTPVVTLLLIAACVVVYVFLQPGHGGSLAEADAKQQAVTDVRFSLDHAAIPDELVSGHPLSVEKVDETFHPDPDVDLCPASDGRTCNPSKSVWLAVLYSMFLHGSWLHLGGNMLFLWIFGNNIEDREGRVKYLVFYLLAGLVATAAQVAISPHSGVPMIGASGAIAGVMGAYLVLYPDVRIRTLFIAFIILLRDVKAKWLLLFWFVLQFFTGPNSGVAWMAHVGGFVFGVLAGLVWRASGRSSPEPAAYSY